MMLSDEYRAYLLRLWRVQTDGQSWRAMLENVETGERQGFASLEKLIEFLQKLGGEGEAPENTQGPGKEANDGIDTFKGYL